MWSQTQPMSYPKDKPLTDKDIISYPEPLPVPLKRIYPYQTPIYKNQTQPMSYPWDKPLTDKDPVVPLPQPGPAPIVPKSYESTIFDKFLEKNRKPTLYKNQTLDISYPWDNNLHQFL